MGRLSPGRRGIVDAMLKSDGGGNKGSGGASKLYLPWLDDVGRRVVVILQKITAHDAQSKRG